MTDIILAADHGGVALKEKIKEYLREKKYFFIDVGTSSPDIKVDYPLIVKEGVDCVLSSKSFGGIFICKSGIGVSIAANRHKGIRAALCRTPAEAKIGREHGDINVLCLGAEGAEWENVKKIVNAFLTTKPSLEERYIRRQKQLDSI